MAFRVCLALTLVLYTALFLIQMEVCSAASNETNVTTSEATTDVTNATAAVNSTVTVSTTTESPSGGAESIFSMLSLALYALCSALVTLM